MGGVPPAAFGEVLHRALVVSYPLPGRVQTCFCCRDPKAQVSLKHSCTPAPTAGWKRPVVPSVFRVALQIWSGPDTLLSSWVIPPGQDSFTQISSWDCCSMVHLPFSVSATWSLPQLEPPIVGPSPPSQLWALLVTGLHQFLVARHSPCNVLYCTDFHPHRRSALHRLFLSALTGSGPLLHFSTIPCF